MAQNFLSCERDQALLMPPSLREWLGQDELAWCVLDVVAEMDLAAIYGDYRVDGHGRAAFDPGPRRTVRLSNIAKVTKAHTRLKACVDP